MLYKGTAVAHYSNFSSIPSGYSENDSYILDSSSTYSEIPVGGGDSLNGYSAPSVATYVNAPDHGWNVTKATVGDIYRVGNNLWQAQENNWVNMGSFRGSDGLTTSISVNGNTYTQSNGTIQLPNYPTGFSGDYNDLTNKPTIPTLIVDDAAIAYWGGDWRMPTTAEFQALGNAVNTEWTTDYQGSGVAGLVCTDKTDSSKVLFFPANGGCTKGNCTAVGNMGRYWSSSLCADDRQYSYVLKFNRRSTTWDGNVNRNGGFAVRGVLDGTNANGHDYVEIGGIKWATMNVGANSVADYGLYFQWGDTQGYTASQVGSGEGQKYFGWADYKYGNGTSSPGDTDMTKYNATDGKTVLELSMPVEYLYNVAVTGDYNDLNNRPTIFSGNYNDLINKPISILRLSISSNVSSTCNITGSSNDGIKETIIYDNDGISDFTVTVPTTYITPDGAAIELTCSVGGYCEVSYLNIGGIIYARGI